MFHPIISNIAATNFNVFLSEAFDQWLNERGDKPERVEDDGKNDFVENAASDEFVLAQLVGSLAHSVAHLHAIG